MTSWVSKKIEVKEERDGGGSCAEESGIKDSE
jgi:hypothetical protein